jgi:chromosomal replication initiation ATPase DnaA
MPRQYHFPLPVQESLAAEDFLPSESNRAALVQILEREPASWPAPTMVLTGPEGCGKTHLLAIWRAKHRAAMPDPANEILAEIVNAPQSISALALDDADKLAGDAQNEEWLQHLYNAARSAAIPFLLTAAAPPAAWGLKLPDIASRLKSCPLVALDEPDDALMRGLLMKQFADRQLRVEDGVIEYLARRLDRTGAAVREATALLDQAALAEGHKISIPFIQTVLPLLQDRD